MGFESAKKLDDFSPSFAVSESRLSTEQTPLLLLQHNGITFEAELNLPGNTFTLRHVDTQPDTDPADSIRLKPYAEKIATEELDKKRELYSQYFTETWFFI